MMELIDRFAVWWCFRRRIGFVVSETRRASSEWTTYEVATRKPPLKTHVGAVVRVIRP